jgi:hypothetical protein
MKMKIYRGLLSLPLLVGLGIGNAFCQVITPISIFGNATPPKLTLAYSSPITLGVKFWSTQPGAISAIRFYRATTNAGGYIARLYTSAGALLGSVTLPHESGPVPGWQVASFAAPISIAANTTYVAAYYVPSGSTHQLLPFGLNNAVTNGPLTAPAGSTVGNGVYSTALSFPRTLSSRNCNFFVDVLFTAAAPTPYLTLSLSPFSPTIASNSPPGTVVATITAIWSNGNPFTGTLSFGAPYSNDHGTFAISGNELIVNPLGPGVLGDGDTTQNVTIVATQ